MVSSVALMITSCDAYKDCWKPMFFSLDKYWPDCEYPRYLVTNFDDDSSIMNVNFVKVGDDKRSWCTLARRGLDVIGTDYVIFFQEDYWLNNPVNNAAIKQHIRYMEENGVDYLKICSDVLRDNYRIGESIYCENPLNIRYSFNTAMAIWRVAVIKELLIDGWSGWEFERQIIPYIKQHSIKINSQCLFSESIPEMGLIDIKEGAIVRGVWTDSAVSFLNENGMADILPKRSRMGRVTKWLYNHTPGNQSPFRWPFWLALRILKELKVNW
jgi:hypothetical protein